MNHLMPRSLAGQMAALLAVALLVAQLVNFTLILNERQKLSLAQNEGPAITRFAAVAADLATAAPEFRAAVLSDASHRGARFELSPQSGVADAARDASIEARLATAVRDLALDSSAVRATVEAQTDARGTPRDRQALRLALGQRDGRWLTARMLTPRRDPWLAARLAGATLLVYLIVLGAAVGLALRLARPLRDLANAADAFGGRAEPSFVTPAGPADLRRAIEAFNAMNRRVVTLLDEKDRMLGAIGHDLRTPLASLRIRIESMDPEDEREAAIIKVEEMTAMLEDILVLARSGRSREPAREVDVTALVDAVVEEHRALGHAIMFAPSARQVLAVQPTLLRRAVGNLIDNAAKYAGGARVAVTRTDEGVEIRVSDDGPGIPADAIAQVIEPFARLESSRNRGTGGTGLGLAIARSVAESHGGSLALTPTPQSSGLTVTISVPDAR